MKVLQLNFSQKIWLGFGIIILLLSLSSFLSLYNLADINDSTTQVNDNAVPVLKQSNQAQISLLKQGKLSSSGYNALNELQIQQAGQEFRQVAQLYDKHFQQLQLTVAIDQNMADSVTNAGEHYQSYKQAVIDMFAAKRELLKAQASANEQLRVLSNLVDDAGAFLLDVVWTEYGDDDTSRDLMEGIQGRLDGLIIGLFNVVDEINRSNDLEYLGQAKNAIADALSGIRVRNQHAENQLADLKGRETWQDYLLKLEEFKQKIADENSIVDLKIQQIEQTQSAREQLNLSEEHIQKVVAQFDSLLDAADQLFNEKQGAVLDTVSLGSKSTLVAWIILLLMASQNFNSMRKSIKKKMADLAKLNSTGEVLASLLDKNKALEEVLAAMHEQVGVAQGSVYLLNEEEKLEVKAFFPPKQVDTESRPAQFSLGEGILGQAAEQKKILFVPNTNNDRNFVNQADMPAKALLCVPLVDKDVLIGVMNFSGDVKQVSFEDSDYEFASSIARLLVTTIKNIRMRETIEEQNRTLEQKVKERTAELRQKNKDIAVMMANLHQGLFTIMEGGVVHHEYSKYLEDILATSNIANRNFMDLLFSDTNLGVDQTNQLATAVDSLIGVDEMMFDFNAHLLVNEVIMKQADGQQLVIELDWVPIVNQDNDEIEKIMVTVRDVTELRKLQLEAKAQRKELEMIGQILSLSSDKFSDFLRTSYRFIEECQQLVKDNLTKQDDVVARLFRNMHTIKGNARTYGLKYVTDTVHKVEHVYDELRKNSEKQWEPQVLLADLELALADIKSYENIATEKLGLGKEKVSERVSRIRGDVSDLISQAFSLPIDSAKNTLSEWVDGAYQVLASSQAQPLSEVISPVVESVYSLADELEKGKPIIKIDDGKQLIKREAHSLLSDVLTHVFRNSMDHGIENPLQRRQQGKAESGTINLNCLTKDSKFIVEIADDGRGLALEKLYQNALKNGIFQSEQERPVDQVIADLVFHSGFSTAEKVTEISGRGVGMDAVKQFLEERGGSIEIVLEAGKEGEAFRPFVTRIILDDECTLPVSVFAEAS